MPKHIRRKLSTPTTLKWLYEPHSAELYTYRKLRANIKNELLPNYIIYILGFIMYLLVLSCYKLLSQRFTIRPIKIEMEATNIQLWRMDFDHCRCCFQNLDSDSLLDLRVAWLSRKQHCQIRTFYLEKIITQDKIFIDDHKINVNEETNSSSCKNFILPSIKPDAIQFEYELRGEQICHLIYRKHKKMEKPLYIQSIFSRKYMEIIKDYIKDNLKCNNRV